MSGSRFNISAAVRNAYVFAGRERGYLARISLLPFGVALVTNYLVVTEYAGLSPFILFLIHMPSTVLYGWFMFLEARLLLLGERADALSPDAAATGRRRAMQASVLVWLLFNMWTTSFMAYHSWAAANNRSADNSVVMFFLLFLFGGFIWSIRFSLAHLLAAVDYPIRQYVYQVNGIGISFRLLALYFICSMPVFVAFLLVMAVAFPQPGAPITGGIVALRIVCETLFVFLVMILTTAAGCFALKEILGRAQREKTA